MRGLTTETRTCFAIGADYRFAGAEVREQLAAVARALYAQLPRNRTSAIAGGFVVSTCHRVEFYLSARDVLEAERDLRMLATRVTGRDVFGSRTPLRRLIGEAAVRHLCRVASGLESMSLGEHEISGQVRRAVVEARIAGVFDAGLEPVVAAAFASSGRVRSETALAHGASSIAGVAVRHLVREGAVNDARMLIVGAGPVAREVARRVTRHRRAHVTIASRSRAHAVDLAASVGASSVDLEDVSSLLPATTVLVAAIRTPGWFLSTKLIPARRSAEFPLLLVDLCLPRAIDPAAAVRSDLSVLTLDDLGPAAAEGRNRQAAAIPHAEAIVIEETQRAMAKLAACQWQYGAAS